MRRFPLLLLLLPVSLFAAGHDLSTPRRYAPSDSNLGIPTVAASQNHFLALWPMSSDLYGALTDGTSSAMPPAFPVLPFVHPSAVRVTGAGTGYLAVWNQNDVPYLGALTPDGALARSVRLDAARLTDPRIAFNGQTILVIDRTGNFIPPATIAASLYDLNGRLIRRQTLPVFGGDSYDVTAVGGDFAIVTAGSSGANEWRIANDGTVLSNVLIEPPPSNTNFIFYSGSIAAKDGRIAIAWMQMQTSVLSSAVIEPDGRIIRVALPNGGVQASVGMVVIPVDVGFVVAWNVAPPFPEKPAVVGVRMDLSSALLDQSPVTLSTGNRLLSAASSGNTIEFALTTTTPNFSPMSLIATVDANGFSVHTASPTAVTPVRQSIPVVAGSFDGFDSAWIERSAGKSDVATARAGHDGQPLDGPGLALDETSAFAPAITRGAIDSLIVWAASGNVLATRVTPSGDRLDPTPLLVAPNAYPGQVAVAWNGSRYFVVWSQGNQLTGAFIGSDGVVTTPRPVGNQAARETLLAAPDMTWDGRNFVVVFGIAPNYPCNLSACPSPPGPDFFRVMRVSAEGEAVDPVPPRIPGAAIRAHVASSGAESLIALDDYNAISTVVVHDEDGGLGIDPVVPFFQWPVSTVSSDVTWDGGTYVVGWEYLTAAGNDPTPGWLAAARVTRSGLRTDSFVTPVREPESITYPESWGPSIASNDARETALVLSETGPESSIPRGRLYLMTELSAMPAVPPAPRNAVSYFSGNTARIEWQGDDVPGFLIEWSFDFGATWRSVGVVPGSTRSITVGASIGNLYRVSAFGPGGVSQGVVTSIGSQPRRRSTGH
jgi:hypothetical protein